MMRYPIVRFLLVAACILSPGLPGSASAQDRPATHTVKQGETLFGIARQYDLTVDDLRRLNELGDAMLRVGQVLRLQGQALPPPPPDAGTPSARPVDASTSMFDLAFRLGVPADSLFAVNPDPPVVFSPGDSVLIPAGFATQSVRVRRGDTLFGLATRHGTSVEAIRTLNRLDSDRLSIGQRLEMPAGDVLPDRIGLPTAVGEGEILEYPDRFAGRLTASGRPYDPDSYVLAHPALELGTVVLLTSADRGGSVFAVVADRMPERAGHLAEVSRAVAAALGGTDGAVTLRIIDRPGGGARP